MMVFTSVFVLEGNRLSFEEIDDALRVVLAHPEAAEVRDLHRRHVLELHLKYEGKQDRTGEKA